jgi:hypothetical protein
MNNFWFDIFFSELSFTNTEKYYLRLEVNTTSILEKNGDW